MRGIGHRAAFGLWCALLLSTPFVADAHSPTTGQVIAEIRSSTREPAVVAGVEQSPDLARMLIVRVRRSWDEAPAAQRVALAERWWASWRAVIPNGIVAVVDADSLASRVSYDREGRARLKDPPVERRDPARR